MIGCDRHPCLGGRYRILKHSWLDSTPSDLRIYLKASKYIFIPNSGAGGTPNILVHFFLVKVDIWHEYS